jgi:hypothetical protein
MESVDRPIGTSPIARSLWGRINVGSLFKQSSALVRSLVTRARRQATFGDLSDHLRRDIGIPSRRAAREASRNVCDLTGINIDKLNRIEIGHAPDNWWPP